MMGEDYDEEVPKEKVDLAQEALDAAADGDATAYAEAMAKFVRLCMEHYKTGE